MQTSSTGINTIFTTTSSGATTAGNTTLNYMGLNFRFPALQFKIDADLPEADKLTEAFQRFTDAAQLYLDQFHDEQLTEDAMYGCMWSAKDARNMVMDVVDKEQAAGDPNKKVEALQTIVDTLSSYVQDCLKMQMDEEQAQQDAMATYQDDGQAEADSEGHLGDELQEAILDMSARRKHATVVRKNEDGSKTYKFPIPDKAHARAALARLNQSDLSAAEKAKVKKRAYRVLGQSPSAKMKEAAVEEITALGEAEDGTIGGSMDDLQLVTIGETAKFDLSKGELEVTFIKPGLNKSGKRFYPAGTIKEGVDNGLFNGLKMFLNHASIQELAQRPERSLTEWVSTVKETWIDEATGDGKAKIKVVQGWFKNFLKDLQEADALGDIGLSIFATGRVKPGTIGGKTTSIVEKFQSAMSIDWVTEPGAGGRVDAIWESHRPEMIKEQEMNVLESMKPDDALRQIRESRPDIYEAVRAEFASDAQTEAEKAAQAAQAQAAQDEIAALKQRIQESDDRTQAEKVIRVKAQHDKLVSDVLQESKLPELAKSRILAMVTEPILTDDGDLDETKVKESVSSALKAEEEYVAEMLKSAGKGEGITGLGESGKTAGAEEVQESLYDAAAADVARRMGLSPEKTEAKV